MFPELDLSDYIVQRSIREFPEPVIIVLRKIIDDLNNKEKKPTQGKFPADFGKGAYLDANLVPGQPGNMCFSILIGVCYDGDALEDRIRQWLDHASLTCPDMNRELFFFSTKWNSDIVKKFDGYIASMRQRGVLINLFYLTPKGLVLMPV